MKFTIATLTFFSSFTAWAQSDYPSQPSGYKTVAASSSSAAGENFIRVDLGLLKYAQSSNTFDMKHNKASGKVEGTDSAIGTQDMGINLAVKLQDIVLRVYDLARLIEIGGVSAGYVIPGTFIEAGVKGALAAQQYETPHLATGDSTAKSRTYYKVALYGVAELPIDPIIGEFRMDLGYLAGSSETKFGDSGEKVKYSDYSGWHIDLAANAVVQLSPRISYVGGVFFGYEGRGTSPYNFGEQATAAATKNLSDIKSDEGRINWGANLAGLRMTF